MKISNETKETRCLEMLMKIRVSLRAAVSEFFDSHFDAEGLRQKLRYSDGKVYEITIKEVKDESRQ